tara:strand:- start:740 stop:916 length:177 start_codon:yes stop_codon:yes gene_type:complete
MIPYHDPSLTEEALKRDLKKAITRGERELQICTNPRCFEDICKGECDQDKDDFPLEDF